MATKRPNRPKRPNDSVGGIDDRGKTHTKRQKTLDECDFKKRDIPKIQGDKEITHKEENMHGYRSRSPGEKSRQSPKHRKDTKDKDSKSSSRSESTKDKSKHSDKHSQHTKDEDSKSSSRRESTKDKSKHSDKHSQHTKEKNSHKFEYKPISMHCDTTKDDFEECKPTPKHCDTTKDDFEFFFGMTSPFSQFHLATFVVRDVRYNCAEQFMMHQKAVRFKDIQIAQQILSEPEPLEQKRLGRKVRGFNPHVWGRECVDIVKEGNIAKFSQNLHLEKQLIATHPRIMAECSPRDCLWGIGLGANNEKAWNVKTWRGKNLLGYALMDVRKYIMKAKGLIK